MVKAIMKYIVILGDGMADEPQEALGGKTLIEAAHTPTIDELAPVSEIGLVNTIPKGMKPGSDNANLSVLGYDPLECYTGRSPLEALSIGAPMKDTDVSMRCNIITLSEEEEAYEDKRLLDHSSGEISTEEAAILLEAVRQELQNDTYKFYTGTSYKHCVIWDHGKVEKLAQPHDHLGEVAGPHLPENETLLAMMKRSYEILVNHPVNQARREKGLNPANSCWFWGAGTKPSIASFEEKYGKKAVMISAVDLLKGIAVGAGIRNINVPGATGGLHTNYEGKAQAALDALLKEGADFAYVHFEGPDEMGHQGSMERKLQTIEWLDSRVIKYIKEQMDASGEDYRMIILPDHYTSIRIRTHSAEPVPYLLYDSTKNLGNGHTYSEKEAKASGILIEEGYRMMDMFLERN